MTDIEFKKAVERYNNLMYSIGYEHLTIGTIYSESTDGWNIRDLVSEVDYTLSNYYDEGHFNGMMKYSEELEERKIWKSETSKLQRFIKAYEPYIKSVKCHARHCSKYDN